MLRISLKQNRDALLRMVKRPWRVGRIFLTLKPNNIFITLTNGKGEVKFKMSSGVCGFKGSKKTSPFAMEVAARKLALKALELNYKVVDIYFNSGLTKVYRYIFKGFLDTSIKIRMLLKLKGAPHGYVRAKKARRK